jgi:acyl-coenzyme A thioesterase PaaI-like protein
MGEEATADAPPVVLADGPFAGWSTWGGGADPYETLLGPFCFRADGGHVRCAFQPRRDHLNGGGAVHGGALMSFADFSLFAIAHNALRGFRAVTLTCNSEFLSAGDNRTVIEATGEVLRETRSLVFVRGVVTQASRPLLAFSGTLKKIRPL